MIDRLRLKNDAKGYIASDRNKVLVAGVIMVIIAMLANITKETYYYDYYGNYHYLRTTTTFSAIFGLLVANTAFEVSKAKAFLNLTKNSAFDYSDFYFGFTNYKSSFVGMFLVSLYTALWSILLVVPGIVKGISYSLTPYILAENPEMKPNEAITLSGVITYGYKMDIFVFFLSFLGWFILTGITLGIAGVYVLPYYNTSFTLLYRHLKNRAIAEGRVDASVFPSEVEYSVN